RPTAVWRPGHPGAAGALPVGQAVAAGPRVLGALAPDPSPRSRGPAPVPLPLPIRTQRRRAARRAALGLDGPPFRLPRRRAGGGGRLGAALARRPAGPCPAAGDVALVPVRTRD